MYHRHHRLEKAQKRLKEVLISQALKNHMDRISGKWQNQHWEFLT